MANSAEQRQTTLTKWKQRAKKIKSDLYALYFAYRDPRVPWYAKVFTALVVAYAFSPIDLIPDFIPVLGYLDDLLLVPLGVSMAVRMVPPEVLAEARSRAAELDGKPKSWLGATVIIVLWLIVIIWLVKVFIER